jgi:threonine aldolase
VTCSIAAVPGVVDLRSDTVTKPTPAMRRAMADAEVGDDGYGEDPTVTRLEETYAALVGKPAAVFVPSGVMANQIALRVLTSPGDVVVTGRTQHVVGYELGAAARNAGIQFHLLDDTSGHLSPDEVRVAIDAVRHHQPKVGGVVLENTHMSSGGVPLSAEQTHAVVSAAQGLPVHLDGARLLNASIALGTPAAVLAAPATTVMSCLSKGLCAPVGSLLAGPADVLDEARVERKRLGGSMRQAGVLAAAGLVALGEMVERLADDHRRARTLAEAVAATVAPNFDPSTCRTNIVAFDHDDAEEFVSRLAALGVLAGTLSETRVRFVTHHDVDDAQLGDACRALVAMGSARS